MKETIGFIGLGLMGKPMARNLLKAGYALVVHSRSSGPVDELVAAGAVRGTSPADVARQARRLITMLPDSADVEEVLGSDRGQTGVRPGSDRGQTWLRPGSDPGLTPSVFSAMQQGTI